MADSFQLKALITGVDKLSPALKGIQKNIKSVQNQLRGLGEGAPALGVGLAAAVGGSLAAFAQSENAATGLKVAMMDAAGSVGPEFKKINDLAVGLGNKLPGTTADFQNMMTMLQRQGLGAETVLGGVGEATAYLAVQLGKAPDAAAEFAAKMQDATGTASKDMMSLFDTIQKAFYMGVDDNNMLNFFGKTSSVLKMIDKDGLKASQALAPLAVMMDQMGMAGESSGNALRKVMQAGFDTKKVAAANRLMSRKGIKLDFTDGNGEFGGLDNLFSQLEKLQSLSSQQRLTVIKQIFGDDAETIQVLGALIDKGKAGYDEIQQKMAKQASLQQRVGEQLGTLGNLWDAMTGTAVNGLAAIGGAFQGDAKAAVTWMGDMAETFSEFAAANPEVIRGVVGVAAGFVALKLAAYGANIALGLIGNTAKLSPLGIFLRVAALGVGYLAANWKKYGPIIQEHMGKIKVATALLTAGLMVWQWKWLKATAAAGKARWLMRALGAMARLRGGVLAAGIAIKWLGRVIRMNPLGILVTAIMLVVENWETLSGWFDKGIDQLREFLGLSKSAEKISADLNAGVAPQDALPAYTTGKLAQQSKPYAYGSSYQPGALAKSYNGGADGKVSGEMVVRFENAPQNLRVDEGKTSPGWSMSPDVGYSRYATR